VAFCHLVSGGDTRAIAEQLQKSEQHSRDEMYQLRLPIVSFLTLSLHVCWTITPFGPIAAIASHPNHSGPDASISATYCTLAVRPFFGAKGWWKWMKQPAYGPAHITPQECAISASVISGYPTRKMITRCKS
jgi:hypothetical protein